MPVVETSVVGDTDGCGGSDAVIDHKGEGADCAHDLVSGEGCHAYPSHEDGCDIEGTGFEAKLYGNGKAKAEEVEHAPAGASG